MGTHVLDAFVVKYALDASGYSDGEREVESANKRLRDSNKRAFTEMEDRGKSTAFTFKGLRNEVVGLGLAFMGAQSILGFASNLMTGAASADRLGNTMNMNVKQIWAWRMAMKGVGGDVKDADAALSSIQRDKMGYRLGQLGGDKLNIYGRLGITGNDLRDADPGDILKKLARVQPKMEAQQYASFLQQIGLPASTVAFLQEGKGSVDKLIAEFEKDAKGQDKLASETKQLQQSVALLQSTIIEKLVPPLVTISEALNLLIGRDPMKNAPKEVGWSNLMLYTADSVISSVTGRPMAGWGGPSSTIKASSAGGGGGGGGWGGSGALSALGGGAAHGDDNIVRYFMAKGLSHDQALGIRAGIHGEGGTATAVNPTSGAFGIGQWLGGRKRELFRRYGPRPTLEQQLEFLWWELSGGDHGGKSVLAAKGANEVARRYFANFMRPQGANNEHYDHLLGDIRRGNQYIAKHRHGGVTVNQTNTFHIKSTDPKGAGREVAAVQRRSAVAQVDRGVAP